MAYHFNPPPNWPKSPDGWNPPPGWRPDPSWPPPPAGWQLWIEVPDRKAPLPHSTPAQSWGPPTPSVPEWSSGSTGTASGLFGRRKQAEAQREQAETAAASARAESAQLREQLAVLQREYTALSTHAAELQTELTRVRGLDTAQLAAEVASARGELAQVRKEVDQARSAAASDAAHDREQLAAQAAQEAAAIDRQISEANHHRGAVLRETQQAEVRLAGLKREIAATDDIALLQEVGIYAYRHPLTDAVAYKSSLEALTDKIKVAARGGGAVDANTAWSVNGSATQGRRMVTDFSKLMLRAYNAEADYSVRSMRPYRLDSLINRLDRSRDTIARLGRTMGIRITDDYHALRVLELELTADFLAKQEQEKERRRELREQQREEERLQREIERERARLAREREQYLGALARLRASHTVADAEAVAKLEDRVCDIDDQLAAVDAREANIRAGYVYVISNLGSFGEHMVKIGLTRRLEPMERVNELGDASVPFRFDVHALIFSEDAVGLEHRLHQEFEARRVNRVNARREFFYVTPAEVRDALARLDGQLLLEYHVEADAPEWRASRPPQADPLIPTTLNA